MKTTTEIRTIATNKDVLRALGIKNKDLFRVTVELTPGELPKLTLVKLLHVTDPADHLGGIDLDRMCQEALARVRRHINTVADLHLQEMSRGWINYEIRQIQLKEITA